MDFSKLIDRVRNVLLNPGSEWPVIAAEPATQRQIYMNYVLPLAALAAICSFLSSAVIGARIPLVGTMRLGVGASLSAALLTFVMAFVTTYLVAFVANALAPSFGAEKNEVQATKAVAYAYTVSWVASVPALLPWLGWLFVLAAVVYGIYQLYLGLQHCMKVSSDKAVGYTIVTVVVAIIAGWLVSMVVGLATMSGLSRTPFAMGMGHTSIGGDGASVTIDQNSAAGALQQWSAKVEEAGKKAEAADKSGDPAAAVAAASGVLGAVLGGNNGGKVVEPLSIDAIKAAMPASLPGMQRHNLSAERNAMGGFQISVARAEYADGAQRDIQIEVSDFGGASGLMAMAGLAASVQSEKETETGYEKTYKDGDRLIHEQWDRRDNRGEYTVLSQKRYSIKVSGKAASIDELKAAAAGVHL